MSSGTILHINAVGLAAAIEASLDHSLRDRPFVIANEALPRATVLDISPRAYREGLRRGMNLSAARGICPSLRVKNPRPEFYRKTENRIWEITMGYSPLVERAGSGHLFIDLAGTSRLFGAPEDAVQKLRLDIIENTGLSPSLALTSNKTVSKVATRVFRPSGFVALSTNEETTLIRRQPVQLLPGVGPVLMGRLTLLDIEEIGQLADLSAGDARAIGPHGPELVTRARGIDTSPVDPEPVARRALHGRIVFDPDTADSDIIRLRLGALVAELAFKLRKTGVGAHKAAITLSYTDGTQHSGTARSGSLRVRDDEILALAMGALGHARVRRVRIRRLALELSEIGAAGPEFDLFEPGGPRLARLQTALDTVHGRFGFAALLPCSALATEGLTL
ncbi:MAG: hypothetical protein LLF89_09430 [Spirochaetaceae bacterium]|nr:hypothetical protein [Spirochaetaceae bacterium]